MIKKLLVSLRDKNRELIACQKELNRLHKEASSYREFYFQEMQKVNNLRSELRDSLKREKQLYMITQEMNKSFEKRIYQAYNSGV